MQTDREIDTIRERDDARKIDEKYGDDPDESGMIWGDPDLKREEDQQAAIWSWIESGDMGKLARLPK